MEGWSKILSFNNLYEAEIRKQLLENAGIQAVVVNARDSLFLVGEIDLYVKSKDEKKALVLLEQFAGLTKINSFILKAPILNFQKYLKEKGIDTVLKERENDKYILENYELYVENEKVDEVVPYLTGEKIDDWKKVVSCTSVRQARYRVEFLNENLIENFIIKKRDSDYHLEEVGIYVKNEDAENATELLDILKNWTKIEEYNSYETAELKEDLLGRRGIRAIIKHNDKFELYVQQENIQKAKEILQLTTEWIEVERTNSLIDAEAVQLMLEDNGIEASILTIKDSVFIIGGYAVYVEKNNYQKAIDILKETKGKIEE